MRKTEFTWTLPFSKIYKGYTQLAFWLLVFFLFIILKEYPLNFTGAALVCIVLQQTLEFAIPCYSQNYLVLPFFKRRQWLTGILLYIVQVLVLSFGLPYILNAVSLPFVLLFHIGNKVDWTTEHITFSMIAFTLMATFFKMALDKLMLENDRKETELRQLKAQLNPHFLFNTLNNLYGLSVIQSPKLPPLMLKLSDLLRYSLYDTNQNYVSLQKELTYITNYIDLEKIRLDDKTRIGFDIQGDPSNQSVSPLLLIIFIENSFKHYSAARNQQAYVDIVLTLHDDTLQLKVTNSLDPVLSDSGKDPKVHVASYAGTGGDHSRNNGIGLTNVRQRLILLYPQKHQLSIKHEREYYEVDLTLNLR